MAFGLDDLIIIAIGVIPLIPFLLIGIIVYYIIQFYIEVVDPEVQKIKGYGNDVINFISKEGNNIKGKIQDLEDLKDSIDNKVKNIL